MELKRNQEVRKWRRVEEERRAIVVDKTAVEGEEVGVEEEAVAMVVWEGLTGVEEGGGSGGRCVRG